GGGHIGLHQGGGDGIGRDALFGKLRGVGAHQAQDASLGGGVVRAHDTAVLRRYGRQVNEATPAGGAHGGKDAPRDEKNRSQIHADELVPDFFGDLLGGEDFGDAGVVHQDADGAEL